MAHELTHALQDQHFDLRRFEHWPKGDSDAELAAHALIEGDATLAMVLYVASNPDARAYFSEIDGGNGCRYQRSWIKAPRVIARVFAVSVSGRIELDARALQSKAVGHRFPASRPCRNRPSKLCIRKSILRMKRR